MNNELFCPEHGPYAASLGKCPYCSPAEKTRPPAPTPLYEENDMTSDGSDRGYSEDDETILPGQRGGRRSQGQAGSARGFEEDGGQTQPPRRRGRLLDEDEDSGDHTVIDRPDTSLMGWLIVKTSPCLRRGHILKIRPGAVFGRSSSKADVVIDDDKVSSIHLKILLKEGRFFLADLGSSNGTWLDGNEVNGTVEIVENSEIRIGNTVFVLKTLA
jgi:hypothetical protein